MLILLYRKKKAIHFLIAEKSEGATGSQKSAFAAEDNKEVEDNIKEPGDGPWNVQVVRVHEAGAENEVSVADNYHAGVTSYD